MKSWFMSLSLLPAVLLGAGCVSVSSNEVVAQTMSSPLIIKVDNADTEAALRASLPALAAACAVSLEYTRPMSGGAHVVRMSASAPEQALACLRAQAGVVYVQEDRLAHPMTGGSVRTP